MWDKKKREKGGYVLGKSKVKGEKKKKDEVEGGPRQTEFCNRKLRWGDEKKTGPVV